MIQAGSRSLPEGRRGVRWVARAIGFALLGIAAVAGATVGLEAQGRQPLTGRVVRVMDGDTIAVRVDKRVFTVRYIGTNTRDARMPGDSVDAGPTEAAEFNRALVLGQTVRLEMDAQEKDAQGRLLAYVYVGDLMVNAELVANGYAEVAIKPPNVMHEEMLQQLQRQARLLKVGRWRDSPYVGREPGSRRAGAPPKQSASAGDPKTAAGRTHLRHGGPARSSASRRVDLPHLPSRQGGREPQQHRGAALPPAGRRGVREDPARTLLRQRRRGARGRDASRSALSGLSLPAAGSPRPGRAASRRTPHRGTGGAWS